MLPGTSRSQRASSQLTPRCTSGPAPTKSCSRSQAIAASGPGGLQAEQVCGLADARVETPGESVSRFMFVEEGVEMPELQVWIDMPDGGPSARVDFLWRKRGVIGEFDGKIKYDDPPEAWPEKKRHERLENLGSV